jgi:8-oxo-dGTP diphosphatase
MSYPDIVLAVIAHGANVLLVQRARRDPGVPDWIFPGGKVDAGEMPADAVVREVREETGLQTRIERLLGVYSDPQRDPRGHTVSVTYLLRREGGTLAGADDADDARFFPLSALPTLAFDHAHILADAKRALNPAAES